MKRPLREFDSLLLVFLCFCAIFAGGLIFQKDAAYAAQPLLQEGKRTVFQRVVSNPRAVLYADPTGQVALGKPRTFTTFYVYARKEGMLRVGVSTTEPQGWLKEEDATEWPQAITMVFTDQMGREPVLFFKSHKDLEDLCAAQSIKDTVEQYVTLFGSKNARVPKDCPVIATEPLEKDGQISQKDFYLLPVLTIDTQFKDDAKGMQLLEVACLDPGIPNAEDSAKKDAEPSRAEVMRTGIVFVVDTTISMKPYIEQTKAIIRDIFDRIQNSPTKDSIAFAVIAFRSNPQIRPKTEYNTRVISDFISVNERDTLEGLLEQLEECRASTHNFDEDSLAGVKEAVDALSWSSVDGKIILLVTDAGPLAGTDSTAKTGMSPEGMADYLRTNGIFLTALHVKTPKGKSDHPYAEKSYRELSKLSNNRSSYIAIDAPNPQRGAQNFQKVGMVVANIFCKIAEDQLKGANAHKPKAHDAP
ncbi:MAG: VWA domain-containing protein, partial [Desulfovibrionaceae bacterium]|nr:VWA domain-containing protein [Desulfovibrionaceae bacterium]